MSNYKLEKTIKEERETFIHIDKLNATCCLYTTDPFIFKRLFLLFGEPTNVFPATCSNEDINLVSGGSWTFDYNDEIGREKIRKMFNITTILPRRKNKKI